MGFELPSGSSPGQESIGRRFRRRDAEPLAFEPGEKPHDIETERAVLAGLFLSNEALVEAAPMLKANDFFLPAHQEIFEAMVRLTSKGTPVDATTVLGSLRDFGRLELAGGATYISEICATPSTLQHTIEYAKIIKDLAWRRRIIDAIEQCRGVALKTGDTRDIAVEIEKRIFDAAQEKKEQVVSPLGEILHEAVADFERLADPNAEQELSVKTGLRDLDDCLSGLRPGQLIVLAAGPGTGKTSLAANIMVHAAIKQAKNVLFFSLEMTKTEVAGRIVSFVANIDAQKLRTGNLNGKDFNDIYEAAEELQAASLFIDDRSMVTPYDVLAQARKLNHTLHLKKPGDKIDLVVVDYIQIMKPGGHAESRALEVAQITGGLKAIAKEMKVPVLALSQLNRDRAKRAGTDSKRPQLSDLKDSGAIEADADVVLFIHREQTPDFDSRAPAEAEIIVAKQRSGPTRSVRVTWLGNLTKFSDWIDPGFSPPDYGPPVTGRESVDLGM